MIDNQNLIEYLFNINDSTCAKADESCLLSQLWSVDWMKILESKFVVNLFNESEKETVQDENILATSISFLLMFIKENFTGPQQNPKDFIRLFEQTFPREFDAIAGLSVDGEELNQNCKYPELLLAGKILIEKLDKQFPESIIIKWWRIRFIYVHQKLIDELANSLYEEFKEISAFLLEKSSNLPNAELNALLKLEIAQGFLLFHRTQKCEEIIENICKNLGVKLTVEGCLGMRTKFQQQALPLLRLNIEESTITKLPLPSETNGKTVLPKLLRLDDEIRLEKIKYMASEHNSVVDIPSIVQSLILATAKLSLRAKPKERLSDEELEPYIFALLQQENGPLPVRFAALFMNINQECNHKRTVERCLKQSEELLRYFNGNKYSIHEQFSFLFASHLITHCEVKKQHGDIMLSLGMVKTALDLYIEINCWEEVIECYTRLDLRHLAADVIRQKIEKKPTVKLYCMLGDVTDDVSCYEKAWKYSNEMSSLAQRHWGNYYFARKEYETALPYLQKTVEMNPLQPTQWLRLGYASLMLERWELASQAYLRYTHLEPNGFESWNNLAKALIKLGDKKRAHKILCEALKCNFNNWKVWENFMLVSADTGNFEDVLNAYQRLTEIKENYMDLEILKIVIGCLVSDTPDALGRSPKRLIKKANTLLAHECVKHGNESVLWELSALIATHSLSKAQKLQRAHRSIAVEKSWSTNKETSLKVLNLCHDICVASLDAVQNHDESERTSVVSQLSSARLTANSCIAAVEKNQEKWDENELLLAELKQLLEKTTNELKSRI